jgi:AcrR family transcriptional regulator
LTGGTRERLLDAAAGVVRRDGAHALTLDAVAAEAGVSKGGLLYHFRSKRDLLDAMVERWVQAWQDHIDAASAEGGFVAGYVNATDLGSGDREAEFGLLAALIAEPAVLETVRERYASWQARLEAEGGDPVQATVARLAADGLWLADLLGFSPPRGALREQVMEHLRELARAGG